MSRLFNGIGDRLDVDSPDVAVVTATPFTVHVWFNSNDATKRQILFNLRDTVSNVHYFSVEARGDIAGDPVGVTIQGGGELETAESTSGFTAGVWGVATGVFASSTDRRILFNGANKGTNVVDITPVGIAKTEAGYRNQTAEDHFMSGRIGPIIVLPYTQTDEEIAAFVSGIDFNWSTRPLAAVWPLWGLHIPEIDLSGNGNTFTVTTPLQGDHAPVTLFTPRRWAASSIDQIIVPEPPELQLPEYGQLRADIGNPPVYGATIVRS